MEPRQTPPPAVSARSRVLARSPLALFTCIAICGCLPRDRLNSACTWTRDPPFAVDVQRTDHRRHLELDVRLAEELGIRHGDSFRGEVALEETHRRREQCTEASIATIMRLHGVGRPEIAAVTGAREIWIDIAIVFLPVVFVFGLASDRIARHVVRAFDVQDRWNRLLSLVALAPVVAVCGLMFVQLWEWLVEWIRLGDSHLSYRAFRLPGQRHAVMIWLFGMAIFACVAVLRYRALRLRDTVALS